jgi:hypothetical protein
VTISALEPELAPLAVDLVDACDLEARLVRVLLKVRANHVFGNDGGGAPQAARLARLAEVGGERLIDEHPAAWPEYAEALRESFGQPNVIQHVAAPHVRHRSVLERKRLDRSFEHRDAILDSLVGDSFARPFEMTRDRIRRDHAAAETAYELDAVRRVAAADVEHTVPFVDA